MATKNGKLGKAIKRVAGKVKKAAHQAKRAVKKRAKKNCPPGAAAKAAFNPASLFAGITPAKVKRIRRVRERQTGQQGDLIGAKQGWAKVRWDNRNRPSLIKRSEIALVNPGGKRTPGVALGDRAKNPKPKPGVALGDRAKNAAKPKPGVALGDRAKNAAKKKAPARNGKKGGAGSTKRKAKAVIRAGVIKKLVINPELSAKDKSSIDGMAAQLAVTKFSRRETQTARALAQTIADRSGVKKATVFAQIQKRAKAIVASEAKRRPPKGRTTNAKKKNPPKSGGAVRKEFLGRDSTKLSKVNVSRHMPVKPTPDILAQLNEVKIKGHGVIKMPRGAKLIADHRKRIWFSERIAKPNPAQDKNTVEPVGEIVHVVYTARKEPRTDALGQTHFGEAKAIPYIHRLGEDSGKRPTLYVDDEGYGVIKGGNYSIDWRGIIG